VTGIAYEIENNSTGTLTVNSSGGNLVGTVPAGVCAHAVCIGTTLTTAADWDWDYISTTTITGTGANVLGTSPTITTPTISSLSSAAATALTLQSAGTTAVTIDTSQNVGIGCTPTQRLQIAQPTAVEFDMFVGSTRTLTLYADATQTFVVAPTAVPMIFKTSDTERMRITSGGEILVGTTTSQGKITVLGSNGGTDIAFTNTSGTSSYFACAFYNNGTTYSYCGGITVSGTTTAYATSSDYRLKENITPMTGALAKVSQLKPVTYKWKADGSDGQGFIAHELQEVYPDAVSGKKDGEQMQGVDYGKLTPILTAALQEAIAKIETLEARIAVLEAK
jgi:hypothetical protein